MSEKFSSGTTPQQQDSSRQFLVKILTALNNLNAMNSMVYPLTDGVALNVNFAHGLAAIPGYRRLALVCTTNDAGTGMTAGQECDAQAVWDGDENVIAFNSVADNSKIYLSKTPCLSNAMSMTLNGVMKLPTSMNNFSLRVYYHA